MTELPPIDDDDNLDSINHPDNDDDDFDDDDDDDCDDLLFQMALHNRLEGFPRYEQYPPWLLQLLSLDEDTRVGATLVFVKLVLTPNLNPPDATFSKIA